MHATPSRAFRATVALPGGRLHWCPHYDVRNQSARTIDAYVLRCAGLDVEAYIKQSMDAVIGKQVVPFELQLPYFDGDLWVEIFLDDIDSPDLAIYGDAETIRRFRSSISND